MIRVIKTFEQQNKKTKGGETVQIIAKVTTVRVFGVLVYVKISEQ